MVIRNLIDSATSLVRSMVRREPAPASDAAPGDTVPSVTAPDGCPPSSPNCGTEPGILTPPLALDEPVSSVVP